MIWRGQLARLGPAVREWWEERAAIMEFDAGLSRDEAEREAFLVVMQPNPIRDVGLDYEPPNGGKYVPADWTAPPMGGSL
jgi:hypothetical protein